MIRAALAWLWPERQHCQDAVAILHQAAADTRHAAQNARRVALDDIETSFGISGSYPPEKVGQAVQDVVRRFREVHGRAG